MSDTEFNRLIDAQKRGEGVPLDQPSGSAELDTRRSKSALGASALGLGSEEVIGYDDASQSPIFGHGPAVATSHPDAVAGAGGGSDIVYGEADEGIIAGGSRHIEAPAAQAAQAANRDLIFGDDNSGGDPVDLSAYAGQSNIVLGGQYDASAQADTAANLQGDNV